MATREQVDSNSQTGKSYPVGGASSGNTKQIAISKHLDASTNSLLGKNGAFNGHVIEVWADGAVWDTVSGSYLFPGRDYNPGDVQRK